jgi:hypothetical protein
MQLQLADRSCFIGRVLLGGGHHVITIDTLNDHKKKADIKISTGSLTHNKRLKTLFCLDHFLLFVNARRPAVLMSQGKFITVPQPPMIPIHPGNIFLLTGVSSQSGA